MDWVGDGEEVYIIYDKKDCHYGFCKTLEEAEKLKNNMEGA